MRKCIKCGTENHASARFCKSCGEQLSVLPAAVSPTKRICANCQTENTLTAKFCKSCGTQMVAVPAGKAEESLPSLPSSTPVSESAAASTAARSAAAIGAAATNAAATDAAATPEEPQQPAVKGGKAKFIIAAVCLLALVLVVVVCAGGFYWYRLDQQRKVAEVEKTREETRAKLQAEMRRLAEIESARMNGQQAEGVQKEPEVQAANAAPAQDPSKPPADKPQPAPPVAMARDGTGRSPPPDVLARQQAAQAAREAAARRQAGTTTSTAGDTASQPESGTPTARVETQPMQGGTASPKAICDATSNFLSYAICETRECTKPMYANSEFCIAWRKRAR